MKRLAIRVLLFLLTFSLGVELQRILFSTTHVDAPPPTVQSPEPVVKIVEMPVPVPAGPPRPVLIFDYDRKKFEPYGYFGIIGNKPRQFQEVDSLAVEVYDDGSGPTGTISVISVQGDDYDSQEAVFAMLTSDRIFFATGPFRSGFEYSFEGVYLHKKFPEAWAGTNNAVIKGTLTKSKNGRKIAQAEVRFRVEHFGC
jgi:hypothetical protein